MYTVFIVDDEELVIESLKASVEWELYGYEVVGYALSGEDALEPIKQLRPDVVFSDIRMPGMNGLELKKRLDDAKVSTKFMIVSGLAEFALVQKAIQYGISGYCLKPFDELEIVGYLIKIKRELDARRIQPEEVVLDWIENGRPEDCERLKHELKLAGISGSSGSNLRIMLTVKKDKMNLDKNTPCITVRIGYRKFIYIMSDRDAVQLMTAFSSENRDFLTGIGFSHSFEDMKEFTKAIQNAEFLAYQYFTLAEKFVWEGAWEYDDVKQFLSLQIEEHQLLIEQLHSCLNMFQGGLLNIRHALKLYNEYISLLSGKGRELDDLFLPSIEHLAVRFEDVQGMIDYLILLFHEDYAEHTRGTKQSTQSYTFHTMLEFINDHFNEDITIPSLSKHFNLNGNYISQLFRRELDKTFTEYLTGLRMNCASELLKTTFIPINEIAEQVGYKDYFYFSKLFKKMIGVPPKTYRNNSS